MALVGIPKQLWPAHPPPQKDELLSSWLLRVAHANGYKPEVFCSLLFGPRSSIWNRDIDRYAPNRVMTVLAQWSALEAQDVQRLSLQELSGVLAEGVRANCAVAGLIPLSIFHRKRRRPGLMYCPQCLGTDEVPYFRRDWRVSFLTACPIHGCQLLDTCTNCGAEVVPHRVGVVWSSRLSSSDSLMARCHRCFELLSRAAPVRAGKAELFVASLSLLALQRGWVNLRTDEGDKTVHSLAFFAGVQALIRVVHRARQRGKCAVSSHAADWPHSANWRGFDSQPVGARRPYVRSVGLILSRWPSGLLLLASKHGLNYTDFRSTRQQLPFWVDCVAREHLLRIQPRVTSLMQEAIAQAAFAIEGRFTLAAARRLSGTSLEGSDMGAHWVPALGRQACELLLAELDHQVAQTWSAKLRRVLLRDKIIFALAWWFGMTQAQLSQLTLQNTVSTLGDLQSAGEPDFWTLPDTSSGFLAWLNWYLKEVRPHLNPMPHERAVFVSALDGAALSASAIGERFRQHRRVLGVEREIPSYDAFSRMGRKRRELIR